MAVRLEVDGLSALKASMGAVRDRIEQELVAAVEVEAEQVVQDARSNVRVDSGDLAQSITAEVDGMSAEVRPRSSASSDAPADHAIKANVNEFGRKGDEGQPYMVPASEASRARWPQRASEALKRGARG